MARNNCIVNFPRCEWGGDEGLGNAGTHYIYTHVRGIFSKDDIDVGVTVFHVPTSAKIEPYMPRFVPSVD